MKRRSPYKEYCNKKIISKTDSEYKRFIRRIKKSLPEKVYIQHRGEASLRKY